MFWLALGYPLFAHLAVLLDEPKLEWFALIWLLGLSLWPILIQPQVWAWLALVGGAAALYWLVVLGHGLYALYVPAIVIPLAMLIVFARSLRQGDTPVVSKVATAMRNEPLPPALVVYARQVTLMWCVVFIVMIASAVGLALWATPQLWSLMTNVVHYVVLGAVFVLEFLYRRLRYAHLERWGLLEYLRRLVRVNLRNIK